MKECGTVASDDTNAVGLDADADADVADETDADLAADVGPGVEGDDQDGKYKEVVADPDLDPDPVLDPGGPCVEEDDDDCDGKYKEADEEEEHKGVRQGRHFLNSLLVSSDFFGLK